MAHFKSLLLLSSFFLSLVSAEALQGDFPFIRHTDFSKLPAKHRARLHKKMTEVFVHLEKKEKFPKYFKSKHSSADPVRFLNRLTDYLIETSVADDSGESCLFGGWPARRNGRCSVPWSPSSRAVASSMETRAYDSDSFCGDDGLFRCNPLIFGPGIDQAMVGDDYPNINGNRNNSAPYHAGICVDISQGYNGLSERCQVASQRLDELRVQHNMAPWREGDFLNEETAAQFRSLQGLIADRCRENREQLNSDNMCTSLESSLGLTAVAVEAGQINGLTPDELFPQCAGLTPPAPRCDTDADPSFNNMLAAMEMLKNNRECNFQAVQAIDDESLGQMMEFVPGECCNPIQGVHKSEGIPSEGAAFSFYFHGADGPLGRVSVPGITAATTPADIVRLITTQDNQEAFNSLCNNAVCPRAEEGHLDNLYQALDEIKGMENCNFGRVRAVDSETNGQDFFEPSSCSLSVEGRLASEGLPHTPNIRGLQQRVPVVVTLSDTQGNFISSLTINAASDMNKESLLSQLQGDELQAACVRSNEVNRADDEAALADVGISEGNFIPDFWASRIADLRNVAEQQGIAGFRVEVRENGDLILLADDPMQISANSTAFLAVINNDPGTRARSALIQDGNGYRVTNTPPAAVTQAVANSSGVSLSENESETVSMIVDGLGQSDSGLLGIQRNNEGVIFLRASSRLEPGLFGSEFEGYTVTEVYTSDGRGPTQYTLTPANADAERVPAAEVSDGSEISLANVRTPTAEEIAAMRAREESGEPPAFTLADVTMIAPSSEVTVTELDPAPRQPDNPLYNLRNDPEDRIAEVFKEEVLDTNEGLYAPYKLLVQVASRLPVLSTNVVGNGTGIELRVDTNIHGELSDSDLRALEDAAEGGATIRQVRNSEGFIVYRISQ